MSYNQPPNDPNMVWSDLVQRWIPRPSQPYAASQSSQDALSGYSMPGTPVPPSFAPSSANTLGPQHSHGFDQSSHFSQSQQQGGGGVLSPPSYQASPSFPSTPSYHDHKMDPYANQYYTQSGGSGGKDSWQGQSGGYGGTYVYNASSYSAQPSYLSVPTYGANDTQGFVQGAASHRPLPTQLALFAQYETDQANRYLAELEKAIWAKGSGTQGWTDYRDTQYFWHHQKISKQDLLGMWATKLLSMECEEYTDGLVSKKCKRRMGQKAPKCSYPVFHDKCHEIAIKVLKKFNAGDADGKDAEITEYQVDRFVTKGEHHISDKGLVVGAAHTLSNLYDKWYR